jgi:hypothetical protein
MTIVAVVAFIGIVLFYGIAFLMIVKGDRQ